MSDMPTQSEVPTVRYAVRDHIAWLTIDNAGRANCLTVEMISVLDDLWQRISDDDDVRVVVLTGAGERHFCAGVDTSVLRGELPIWSDGRPHNRTAFTAGVNKPVITVVNGAAIGLGMNLALDADLVVAVAHSQFGDPRVEFGLLPNAAIVNAYRAPLGDMARVGLAGQRLSAVRAREIGLVADVADTADDARAIAHDYAAAIAARPPAVVQESVRLLRASRRGEAFGEVMRTVDATTDTLEGELSEANRAGAASHTTGRIPNEGA